MLHFYQQRMSIPISPYLQQHLLFPSFLITAILEGAKQYLIMVLIYICLMTNDGEGNGNPLQYSCQENPMDRGAWWAAVHEVTKSRTRLKRLGSISSMSK